MIVILKGLVLLLASLFVLLCPPLSLLAVAFAHWDDDPTPVGHDAHATWRPAGRGALDADHGRPAAGRHV